MSDFIPKKIFYPVELHCLQKEGFLVPGKSKLKTTKGLLVFIKLVTTNGYFQVVLEDQKGESMILNTNQFRELECETLKPPEISYEPWTDPA